MNKNKGSVLIFVIAIVAIVAVVSVVIFKLLKDKKLDNGSSLMMNDSYKTEEQLTASPEPSPVSDSNDINVMEKELNSTQVDITGITKEFKDLNASASSL